MHFQQQICFRQQQQHVFHTKMSSRLKKIKRKHLHVGTVRKATKTALHNACFGEKHLVAAAVQRDAPYTALFLLPPAGEIL